MFGQLGNDTTNDNLVPTGVVGLSGVKAISLGDIYSCAITSTNQHEMLGQ
jgi:hypothetical protein